MYLGSTQITGIKLGSTDVSKVYSGSTQVFPRQAVTEPFTGTLVIAALGQSNMCSRATYTTGDKYPSGVYEYDSGGNTVSVAGNTNIYTGDSVSTTLSLTVEFAVDFMAANPDATLILVGYAKGGTGFAQGDWNEGDAYYNGAVTRINGALSSNSGAVFGGWLWHQGENDAVNNASSTYAANLSAFITAMRGDITGATSVTPFVAGEIAPGDSERIAINTAMRSVEGLVDYVAVTEASDLATSDGVHFTEAGQRALGGRYYTNWSSALSNSGGTAS